MKRISNRKQLEQFLSTLDNITIHYIIINSEFSSLNITDKILHSDYKKRAELIALNLIKNNKNHLQPLRLILEKLEQLIVKSLDHHYLKCVDANNKSMLKYLFYRLTVSNFQKHSSDKHKSITTLFEMHNYILSSFINGLGLGIVPQKEMEYMLNDYYNFTVNFDWLISNDLEQANWTLRHLSNHEFTREVTNRIGDITMYINEFKTTTIGIIHALNKSNSEKELFILKMKKSWGQIKYRNKIKKEEKTTINMVISKSTKEKLHHIAMSRNLSLNSAIEYLITNEWEKINAKKTRKI
ncbi:hypothetical protein [Vibrio scophthalmi]|uniref:Uncharacterized protein n=1 Tax=Vibrio scophthalmi TaxID=45658 RepID=A0A1E3WH95_9VIBR|nr:hypothetical protein [Vibrio scophthalmi]ODS04407.1 hypothetical protein VSF3289_03546 [Vibrio scophthalmi]